MSELTRVTIDPVTPDLCLELRQIRVSQLDRTRSPGTMQQFPDLLNVVVDRGDQMTCVILHTTGEDQLCKSWVSIPVT